MGFRRSALSGAPAVLAPRLNVVCYVSMSGAFMFEKHSCICLGLLSRCGEYAGRCHAPAVLAPGPLAVVLALLAPPLRCAHPLPLPLALSALSSLLLHNMIIGLLPVGCGAASSKNFNGRCCFEKGCAGVCYCKGVIARIASPGTRRRPHGGPGS